MGIKNQLSIHQVKLKSSRNHITHYGVSEKLSIFGERERKKTVLLLLVIVVVVVVAAAAAVAWVGSYLFNANQNTTNFSPILLFQSEIFVPISQFLATICKTWNVLIQTGQTENVSLKW